MSGVHLYSSRIAWSGSTAVGYDAYDRRHAGAVPQGGITVPLSGDAAFGGDPALPNPEQLLVLAASSCQLLSFLAVAARARVEVMHYTDDAEGEMPDGAVSDGVGPTGLTAIRLRPSITVVDRPDDPRRGGDRRTGAPPVRGRAPRVLHRQQPHDAGAGRPADRPRAGLRNENAPWGYVSAVTRPSPSAQPARQLSLVAADMSAPGLEDLEGLLCGTGHVVRGIGGNADSARISVLVDDEWRVRALESRLAEMDLLDPSRPAATPGRPHAVSVRTRFDPRLLAMAARWTRGATPVAPAALHLDGPRLWWWAVSAGVADRGAGGRGIKLRLARSAPQRWTPVGAALAEAGVPGIFLGPRADGPAYRLVGTRRLTRLADLVGEAPDGAPPEAWPSSAIGTRRSRLGGTRTLPAPTAAGDDRTAEPPGTTLDESVPLEPPPADPPSSTRHADPGTSPTDK